MKRLFLLLLICLLSVTEPLSGQFVINNKYHAQSYDDMVQPMMMYKQAYEQFDAQLVYIMNYIVDILGHDIDNKLRVNLNEYYETSKRIRNKMQTEGLFANLRYCIESVYEGVSDQIVAYNNRVADAQAEHERQMEEERNRQKEEQRRLEEEAKKPKLWTGTGFALTNGFLVTNYHVVENAVEIKIRGVAGDFSMTYTAEIVASDATNDLALLKIKDANFKGFGKLSYAVKFGQAEVGESVFVLGYPLTATMGDEIKYTTGVISSRTGYQGNIAQYQMTAPVQPGNSGCPLFDNRGNIIGIVSAKHDGAENVGYAIKSSYLRELVSNHADVQIIPQNNQVSKLTTPEKINTLKKRVFIVECKSAGTDEKTYDDGIRVIKSPRNASVGDLELTEIELTQQYTTLYFKYTNNLYSGWCSISPSTYIKGMGDSEKQLKSAVGIEISPKKHYFNRIGETLRFALIFPPLENWQNVMSLDFVEDGNSSWKLYNIILK